MFIWTGISVDSQLQEIKGKAMKIEYDIGFANSNFTLPLHISLKISFPIADELVDSVITDICALFEQYEPFTIECRGLKDCKTIAWLEMNDNDMLNRLHDELNAIMLNNYQVPLHPYDLDYLFHTTLYMDSNEEKVHQAYELTKDVEIPKTLLANRFVIGLSKEGKLGTFYVHKEIIK